MYAGKHIPRRGAVLLLIIALLLGLQACGGSTPAQPSPTAPTLIDITPTGSDVTPGPAPIDEKWWLEPQTYHTGEGPYENIPDMGITVLHDWSSSFWGREDNPDEYWSYAAIRERWDLAHAMGMRVEAVISMNDIWFIRVGPDDPLYPSSGIDLNGEPIQYDDPPAFVGCTNLQGWLEFLEQRMMDAVDMGVDGFIIDDYEGSSRWVSGTPTGMAGLESGPGGCFCQACEAGFRDFLRARYSSEQIAALGIPDLEAFDYSDYLLERGWTIELLGEESLKFAGWEHPRAGIDAPLYEDYAAFQNERILEFSEALKESVLAYARQTYGRELSWSFNAPELIYSTHKFFAGFDRNVGGIAFFGYPPLGAEGYLYRLGFEIFGLPRIREVSRDPMIVALINEYQPDNLLAIKDAEAYANRGAWVEQGYYVEEGADEDQIEDAFHTDVERKRAYNDFYLANADVFDFSTTSLAKVAVIYSSASINHALYNHLQSFNGICEILTDLHVQYDPLFAGDGLSAEDDLTPESLQGYELVFLPHVYALTRNQAAAILAHVEAGGTVIALGDVGLLDEYGAGAEDTRLAQLLGSGQTEVGAGRLIHLRVEAFQTEGIYDDGIHDLAAGYYTYYIENGIPEVWPFFEMIDEEPGDYMSEASARGIRGFFADLVDGALGSRVVLDRLSENIGVQLYFEADAPQRIIVHLINYDYELAGDTVNDLRDIPLEIELPPGFEVGFVRVISPDFEGALDLQFELRQGYVRIDVPELHIWDVVIIG